MIKRKLISVIVPAFNEEDCLEELAHRLALVFDKNYNYDFEAIIIENGSQDGTWDILKEVSKKDARFKIVQLARNFRMDGGITAGLDFAKGDAAVIMTADLQDPPELISNFIAEWEKGYENIYMIVTKRTDASMLRRFNSKLFYALAGKLTSNQFPKNASDFRLVDRKVYETVRSLEERNRFVRGLFSWVGFRSKGIEHERPERFGGTSKAYTKDVLDLALKGIFAHSYVPLRIITVFGFLVSGASILSTVAWGAIWIKNGVPFAGFGTLVSIQLLCFGALFLTLGVVSEYIGLIYEEVKQRPNFVIKTTLGFDDKNLKDLNE